MASRAELTRSSASPSIGGAFRSALTDFYFNSARLVPVNILWGLGVVLVILVGFIWPFGVILLAPLLALPTAVIFRVASQVVRGDVGVSIREALSACRDDARAVLLLGVAYVIGFLTLATNLVVGFTQAEPTGWVLATFAAWGLVVLWCLALLVWPLLVDPMRADKPARERLRLAGLLLLANPGRIGMLGAAIAIVVVASTILAAAILTISVAYVALVSCRYAYPAAERLERQLGTSP